ncbi:DUF4386 domain-containing protein [Tenacibaculum amylolyticum]|uniref:DUF4386 domain-containing protein n=1 Tax=Tenacibaculum amylolyticum TaxID=104269 RepID=UPI003895859F
MNTNKRIGRVVGILFLFIFIAGVATYQFLQAPLFSDDFINEIAANRNQIISSVLLNMLSGIISISIAVLLLPTFKKYSYNLAMLYFSFTFLNFIAIVIDNGSIFSLLEFSIQVSGNNIDSSESLNVLKTILYKKHWWTHYVSLLTSSVPVFVFYYNLYFTKLVPRIISTVGMIATTLMFIEMLSSIFGNSISMNLLLPMGLIQLFLPFWLFIKGLKEN